MKFSGLKLLNITLFLLQVGVVAPNVVCTLSDGGLEPVEADGVTYCHTVPAQHHVRFSRRSTQRPTRLAQPSAQLPVPPRASTSQSCSPSYWYQLADPRGLLENSPSSTDVDASPINDPATVAVTITRRFPSLSKIVRVLGGLPDGIDLQGRYQAGWDEVSCQYLPMSLLVRRDERLRILQENREQDGD